MAPRGPDLLANLRTAAYVRRVHVICLDSHTGSELLRLTTFGGLALSRDGTALTGAAAQRSRLSLLALLATAGPTGFSRDKLLLYLWPESDEERARHALKQAVYSLRRELGSDEVIVGTASLSLNPLIITSDAREFEAAIAAGDLQTAVSLYAGPFLDGFHLKDSTEFERWSAEQRAHFAHLWVSSVERLATDCESRGAWREAAGFWRKLAAAEPLSGRLALCLMRSLAESGDLGAALQQFKIHETLLQEEIGSAPEAAVAAFAESLRAGTWTRSPEKPQARVSPVVAASAPVFAGAAEAIPATAVAGVAAPPARFSIGSARKRRRRSTALAFVLGVILMATTALTVKYASLDPDIRARANVMFTRPDAVLDPHQIVVAPFVNKTGRSELDGRGEQVADWLTGALGAADFKVVDTRTARIAGEVIGRAPKVILRDANDYVALGKETGAGFTIYGNYYLTGDSIETHVMVLDVSSKNVVSLGRFYQPARLSEGVDNEMLERTVAYLAREVDTTAGGQTIKYTTWPSAAAGKRWNTAWEKFFQFPGDTAAIFAELDTSAHLDSLYPSPLLMKAYMLDVKSLWPRVDELVKRARPLAPRMTKFERASLELFDADLAGDHFARLKAAEHLRMLSPASGEMPLLRVVTELYIGNVDAALEALKTANPTRGINLAAPTYLEWSAATYHHAGKPALEERAVRDMKKLFRYQAAPVYGLARVLAARNDPELTEVLARGLPARNNETVDPRPGQQDLTMFAARELRAHGYPAEAKRLFIQLTNELRALPPNAPAADVKRRARALYESEDYQAARDAFSAILKADSTNVEAMSRIATSSLRLGDSATARSMDARLAALRLPFAMGAPMRARAAIAMVRGQRAEAIRYLELAVRQGLRLMDNPPNLTVHLDADFVGLEKTAEYKAMLKTLAEEAGP